jgi:hypothetical protein
MPNFQNLIEPYSLAWGSGSTFSGSVYLGGNTILAVGVPGTWTTAALTLQVSVGSAEPGADWRDLYAGTTEWAAYPATKGTALYYLPVSDAPGLYWVRGRSGAGAAGTAQGAARTLELLTRPV